MYNYSTQLCCGTEIVSFIGRRNIYNAIRNEVLTSSTTQTSITEQILQMLFQTIIVTVFTLLTWVFCPCYWNQPETCWLCFAERHKRSQPGTEGWEMHRGSTRPSLDVFLDTMRLRHEPLGCGGCRAAWSHLSIRLCPASPDVSHIFSPRAAVITDRPCAILHLKSKHRNSLTKSAPLRSIKLPVLL